MKKSTTKQAIGVILLLASFCLAACSVDIDDSGKKTQETIPSGTEEGTGETGGSGTEGGETGVENQQTDPAENIIELKNCSVLHGYFKELCNLEAVSFARAAEKPETASYYMDAAGTEVPLWYDTESKILYYYHKEGKTLSLRTEEEYSVINNSENKTKNGLFYGFYDLTFVDLSSFDTSNVTDMSYMFGYCSDLTSLDLRGFDTGKVTDMSYMFGNCSNLTSVDLSTFDTSNVTDMSFMFYFCNMLISVDLRTFDTGNVTDMAGMFGACSSLTSLDFSNFDTGNVTDMRGVFYNCGALTELDLSSFDTGKVWDMSAMFHGCFRLTTLDLSSFDTVNVMTMSSMFRNCVALTNLDLSTFDTSNVTDMYGMFYYCSNLKNICASENFVTSQLKSARDMFEQCPELTGGKGTVYNEKYTDKTYARIDGGESAPGYFTAKTSQSE